MPASSPPPSLWTTAPPPPFIPLRHDAQADVCVIGAGISGLSVAYELCLRGASVMILDQGPIGHGQTAATTAHLVTALDERYFELERLHGAPAAALVRDSHAVAIDRMEAIVAEEVIDCGFLRLDGYIFVPPQRAGAEHLLARELAAATRAGAIAERLSSTPGLGVNTPCLRFPDQAQLNPRLYLDGLAGAIRTRRGRLFTGTRVTSVEGAGEVLITTSDHFQVRAAAAVIATNCPIRERTNGLPSQIPYRSFVIAMKIPPGAMTPALYWDGYWDLDTPYHYVRLAASSRGGPLDLLVVGGEDEGLGSDGFPLSPDHHDKHRILQDWAKRQFPFVGEVTHRWHGRILEPDDELAFIGRLNDEKNVYIISGDSGNGMTYAAIAGMLLPELIAGRDHPWAEIYSPTRRCVDTPARRMLGRAKASNR